MAAVRIDSVFLFFGKQENGHLLKTSQLTVSYEVCNKCPYAIKAGNSFNV
jgi:hypothetical protein